MKLSIIVPVYRTEATLKRCLESVVCQDFADFEIILVDDGSPDDSPRLCDEWAKRDSRIHVVHQANQGLSAARNTGIDHSQGDFLTFIDSDDYIAPGTLSAVMADAENADLLEYPIKTVAPSPLTVQGGFATLRISHLSPLTLYSSASDYWLTTRAYLHTYACNKIYRRWLFNDVRFPVGRVFEDACTLPLLLHLSPRIATTNRGCYCYCQNSQGITANADGQQLSQLLDAHLASQMPMDDEYYMHLLNIQSDVCELTSQQPRLPQRHINAPFRLSSFKLTLKAITLNLLGIKRICKLNKIIHNIFR